MAACGTPDTQEENRDSQQKQVFESAREGHLGCAWGAGPGVRLHLGLMTLDGLPSLPSAPWSLPSALKPPAQKQARGQGPRHTWEYRSLGTPCSPQGLILGGPGQQYPRGVAESNYDRAQPCGKNTGKHTAQAKNQREPRNP